uniref:Sulfatase N-terminal domain-containing protein n=1 Tax=Ciona intestinalis TaxID=7719 RepID=F6TZG1_CIOIN
PNIVFILADDYGFNDIGYHAVEHHSDMKTPFLDSLAMAGVRLENYYIQPICSPSRSVLMSGRYQIHTGLQHYVISPQQRNGLPLDNIILPEQLHKCGYDTHMVGKWHLGFYKDEYLPWKRGFNSYFGYLTGGEDYYTKWRCDGKLCGYDMTSEKGPTNATYGQYSANLFANKANEAIDKHDKTKPLFLYVAFQSVHSPMEVPESYAKPFDYIKNHNRKMYGGMVAAMDEAVKNITEHLQAAGLWDNTILVFSADNGGQTLSGGNNWPLRGRKLTLWEGGIKGVGFVHGKILNVPNPNYIVNNEMIHISDWFPTIMEATQCPYVEGTQKLDGVNQWDTIFGKTVSARKEILLNIDPLFTPLFYKETPKQNIQMGFDTSVHAGIRYGEWKLLTGLQGDDRWIEPPEWKNKAEEEQQEDTEHPGFQKFATKSVQLYNIVNDPYEQVEVSDLYPSVVNDLLSKLAAYNATAVPVNYPPSDPTSDPSLHGGFWGPWV